MKETNRRLTPKQALFVNEYMKDLCATHAANRAGYADSSYGRKLYTRKHVREAIEREQKSIATQSALTVGKVISSLEEVHRKAIEANDLSNANRALELLGRHLGAFSKDNKQSTESVNVFMNFVLDEKQKVLLEGGK